MKRFLVVTTLSVAIILAAGMMFKSVHSGSAAVPVVGADFKVAPMFDTTGRIVSDPTGTIMSVHTSGSTVFPMAGADIKVAPVFDTTGKLISDPTGTILNTH